MLFDTTTAVPILVASVAAFASVASKLFMVLGMKKTAFFAAKRRECKFKEKCSLYANTSFTCNHNGGSYCGRYRKLNQDSAKSRREIFVVIPQ
jgi:hypothetical protein